MGDTVSGRGRTRTVRRRRPRPQAEQPQQSQQRRTPQEWLDYFDRADTAQAMQALNEWRQERMDADDRSADTDIQRFFHNIGWTENTPVALDENEYQQAYQAAGRPKQLYHSDEDTTAATGSDYAAQYFGDGRDANGNPYRHYVAFGIYGGGTYYASSASDSAGYGGNQFRGFLNSRAKVADWTTIRRQYYSYVRSHPGFAAMMRNVKTGYGNDSERVSIFAAMKGYNVIHDRSSDYYVVLDRSATTVSRRQKNRNTERNWYYLRDW